MGDHTEVRAACEDVAMDPRRRVWGLLLGVPAEQPSGWDGRPDSGAGAGFGERASHRPRSPALPFPWACVKN